MLVSFWQCCDRTFSKNVFNQLPGLPLVFKLCHNASIITLSPITKGTFMSGHHHDHSHGHCHHHLPADGFNKAFIISIAANLAYTIIQFIYAYVAHSTSLLADAGHNLGDVLGLVMAWIASLLLKKQANARYSYGFKKTTILASILNALILIFTCGLIIREAVEKFIHPTEISAIAVAIVAFIGIIINAGTALLFMRGRKSDLNIKGAFLHLAFDALVSFGVVIAAILIYFTGWQLLDPIVGMIIAAVILWGTWGLLRDSINLVMDGVPRDINSLEVKHYLENLPGVTELHDLHIWGLSTKENALTAHLVMPEAPLTDSQRRQLNHQLAHQFNIHHTTIQIEHGKETVCDEHNKC